MYDILIGKYNEYNNNEVAKLIYNITKSEYIQLQSYSIEELWKLYNITDNASLINTHIVIPLNILQLAKQKLLKIYPTIKSVDLNSLYDFPEWEIPKGHILNNESELNCAIREFNEETNINPKLLHIFNTIPSIETFYGSDNRHYIYIYYYAVLNAPLSNENILTKEASMIGSYELDECIDNIRKYNSKRKLIIYLTYLHLIKRLIT